MKRNQRSKFSRKLKDVLKIIQKNVEKNKTH